MYFLYLQASIENLVKILVGVKCDLESDREVPTKQGHSVIMINIPTV